MTSCAPPIPRSRGSSAAGPSRTICAPDRSRAGAQSGGKRYEVELPLLDAKGGVVGALTVGWPLRKGRDEKAFLSQAEKIRDELRGRIPALEKLVELDP